MNDAKTAPKPMEAQAAAYGIDPEDMRLTAALLGPDDALHRLFHALELAEQAQHPSPGAPHQPQR